MDIATDPEAVFAVAMRLHKEGRLGDAAELYDRLLSRYATHVDTLQFRGLIDMHEGRFIAALAYFERILAVAPDNATAWANRAAALNGAGRYEEARRSSEKALALGAASPGPFANLATALTRGGRHADAVEASDRALALGLEDVQLHSARAEALKALGRDAEAAAALQRMHELQPDVEGLVANAAVLIHDKTPLQAIALCDQALALDPQSIDALLTRARALQALDRYQEAIADCDRAMDVNPDEAKVYAQRGLIFKSAKQPERALADFEGALELDPDMDLIPGESVFLSLQAAEWDGFEAKVANLLSAIDAGKYAAQPFVTTALPASPVQHLKAAARYFAFDHPEPGPPVKLTGAFGDKIRIGYFSSDLHEHPVGQLIVGLLEAHDRSRFEIVAFAFGGLHEGPTRERIARACDEFINVSDKSPEEIAALAREKRIHIAVDLNGYTAFSRPAIFAAGAAPVQVNYLGYPGTLGGDVYHYIVGDRFVTPPEHYDGFAERVVTMPHAYLVTNDIKRHVPPRLSTRRELGAPEIGFIFACFNASFKITPDVFDVWMRLLAAVDGSVLWLNDAGPTAKRNLRREAKERGVAPERLIFAPRTPGLEYLARYKVADLFLDTFYYNAHATGSEALMMGLPVVTRIGPAFAGRVGASLLTTLGLPELIGADSAAYERIALNLARDPAALARVRDRLTRNVAASPLFDTKGYTRHLEAAYHEMWRRNQQGLAPDHIVVGG